VSEAMGVKFLAKKTTAGESPNWASNLEPCDYQAYADMPILTH